MRCDDGSVSEIDEMDADVTLPSLSWAPPINAPSSRVEVRRRGEQEVCFRSNLCFPSSSPSFFKLQVPTKKPSYEISSISSPHRPTHQYPQRAQEENSHMDPVTETQYGTESGASWFLGSSDSSSPEAMETERTMKHQEWLRSIK